MKETVGALRVQEIQSFTEAFALLTPALMCMYARTADNAELYEMTSRNVRARF